MFFINPIKLIIALEFIIQPKVFEIWNGGLKLSLMKVGLKLNGFEISLSINYVTHFAARLSLMSITETFL